METRRSGGKVFWILIPLVIIIASFLYDNAIQMATEKKYRLDSEAIITEVLENSFEDSEKTNMVERMYQDKGYEVDQLSAQYIDETLYVYNVHVYPSFFTRLFGVKSYRTEVDIKGSIKDNKVIIVDN